MSASPTSLQRPFCVAGMRHSPLLLYLTSQGLMKRFLVLAAFFAIALSTCSTTTQSVVDGYLNYQQCLCDDGRGSVSAGLCIPKVIGANTTACDWVKIGVWCSHRSGFPDCAITQSDAQCQLTIDAQNLLYSCDATCEGNSLLRSVALLFSLF